MAATAGTVCVTLTLLMCVIGGQALDLLRVTATSGSEYQSVRTCSWFIHCGTECVLPKTELFCSNFPFIYAMLLSLNCVYIPAIIEK